MISLSLSFNCRLEAVTPTVPVVLPRAGSALWARNSMVTGIWVNSFSPFIALFLCRVFLYSLRYVLRPLSPLEMQSFLVVDVQAWVGLLPIW